MSTEAPAPTTTEAPPANAAAPGVVPTRPQPKTLAQPKRLISWRAFLPRVSDDEQSKKAERKARRKLEWDLIEESNFYMGRMLRVFERRDELSYRYKKYEQDWLISGRSLPKFTTVVMQPEALYFRVDTVGLPPNVNIENLKSDETRISLSLACGRNVWAEHDEHHPEKGFWFVVERTSGVRGIPIHVRLDEIWAMRSERHGGLALPFGIGENKKPIWRDMDDQPHMLVAGSPGTGKSNFLGVLISTLIRFNAPHRVKLALVDLKGSEFNFYAEVPHILMYKPIYPKEKEPPEVVDISDVEAAPEKVNLIGHGPENPEMRSAVITHASEVLPLLKSLYKEVARRNKLMAAAKVRNIGEYNWKSPRSKHLPHVVVVIDELAQMDNLMGGQDFAAFMKLLVALVQLSRSAGVHVIPCTQTPTKRYIPAALRNALPVHLAFSCSNATASTLIIGNGRAAGLSPKGRAILHWDGRLHELQSPLITTRQIDKIVAAAMRGEWDDVSLSTHDVTEEDIFKRALEEFEGKLPADDLWKAFKNSGRRIPRDELRGVINAHKGKQVIVGSAVYLVEPGFANRPPYLRSVQDSEEKEPPG